MQGAQNISKGQGMQPWINVFLSLDICRPTAKSPDRRRQIRRRKSGFRHRASTLSLKRRRPRRDMKINAFYESVSKGARDATMHPTQDETIEFLRKSAQAIMAYAIVGLAGCWSNVHTDAGGPRTTGIRMVGQKVWFTHKGAKTQAATLGPGDLLQATCRCTSQVKAHATIHSPTAFKLEAQNIRCIPPRHHRFLAVTSCRRNGSPRISIPE
jgi:hypothetical protein